MATFEHAHNNVKHTQHNNATYCADSTSPYRSSIMYQNYHSVIELHVCWHMHEFYKTLIHMMYSEEFNTDTRLYSASPQ